MATKPPNWDSKNPSEKICIFCFGHGPRLVVWKYGVHWVCYEGKCKKWIQEMPGFAGIFTMTQKREAEALFSTQELGRRMKAPKRAR